MFDFSTDWKALQGYAVSIDFNPISHLSHLLALQKGIDPQPLSLKADIRI